MSEIENPEVLEVVPGFAHDQLEGWVPELATEEELRAALEKAFDYRGDVTMTLVNGQVEGYMFNRDAAAIPPRVEIFVKGNDDALVIPYTDIIAISFTGKDTADGKSWEAWVTKKESERKAEAARIEAEAKAQGHL